MGHSKTTRAAGRNPSQDEFHHELQGRARIPPNRAEDHVAQRPRDQRKEEQSTTDFALHRGHYGAPRGGRGLEGERRAIPFAGGGRAGLRHLHDRPRGARGELEPRRGAHYGVPGRGDRRKASFGFFPGGRRRARPAGRVVEGGDFQRSRRVRGLAGPQGWHAILDERHAGAAARQRRKPAGFCQGDARLHGANASRRVPAPNPGDVREAVRVVTGCPGRDRRGWAHHAG